MNKMPTSTRTLLLSVIVPVYNAEQFLPDCMTSLLAQSHQNLEILLVDDASPGNVKELYETLWKSDSRVKLISHSENRGLFAARITGMQAATGEWVTSVDPDDTVSIDRFRVMLREGVNQDADMVVGDIVLDFPEQTKRLFYPHSEIQHRTEPLKGTLIDALLEQQGENLLWHVVWGKIYKRSLMQAILPLVMGQTKHLIMCEDVTFSVAFFLKGHRLAFVHDNPYYYRKHGNASTMARSYTGIKKNIEDLAISFDYARKMLCEAKRTDLLPHLTAWQQRYAKSWCNEVMASPLSTIGKSELLRMLRNIISEEEMARVMPSYLEKTAPIASFTLSDAKRIIADERVKCVSFDVFDTLIVRPFWRPTDLFILLGKAFVRQFHYQHDIDFAYLRIEAERRAREVHSRQEEVTLDQIYTRLKRMTDWSEEWISWIKTYEITLEAQFCERRKATWELYDFARYLGKRLVFTSDMYLPTEVVRSLVEKAGYTEWEDIFVSSAIGKTKATGTLYRHLCKSLHLEPNAILHIGDTWGSDIESAQREGLRTLFLQKSSELLQGWNKELGCHDIFDAMFSRALGVVDGTAALEFIGIRSMLAVCANRLFDNPFHVFPKDSDFGGDAFFFGTFPLGMHMLAFTQWLQRTAKRRGTTGLHFLARDGWLPMKSYECLYGDTTEALPHDYWHINRRIANQLQLRTKEDLLSWFSVKCSGTLTVRVFCDLLKRLLPKDTFDELYNIVSSHWDKDARLEGRNREVFVRLIRSRIFKNGTLKHYQEAVISYLKSHLFGIKDGTVDIGYSCRSESILARYGITVTPFYFHVNSDVAADRCQRTGEDMETFYDFKPSNTGVVREIFLSNPEKSCIGYDVNDTGEATPSFEKKSAFNYTSRAIIGIAQQAAVDMIATWKRIFGHCLDDLNYRYHDASLPYEFFLHYSTNVDHEMLSCFRFEDALGAGEISPDTFWDNEIWTFMNVPRGKAWSMYLPHSRQQIATLGKVSSNPHGFIYSLMSYAKSAVKEKDLDKRARLKNWLPYGIMVVWLREFYGIEEDLPLKAYPGQIKRFRRLIKFCLPYGWVKRWKNWRYS